MSIGLSFCGLVLSMGILLAGVMAPSGEAQTIYVSPGGTNDAANRYNTWEGAATSINDAVAIAAGGETVLVTNGAYAVTTNLAVTGFTVQGVNGPGVTTLYRPSSVSNKMFVVSHSNAWVSGFTLSNAYVNIYGAGQALELAAGTVSNCVITRCNSLALGGNQAYMALISGGLMTHCVISNNQSRSRVVGVFSGGVLQDSVLSDNSTPYDPSTLYISGTASTARRCRIFRNSGVDGGARIGESGLGGRMENCFLWGNVGGAVRIDSGGMVNCTVASNSASAGAAASGINRTGGFVTNCIAYGNSSAAPQYGGSASAAWYSCAPELTLGSQGNVNTDPKFVNMAAGDCHLAFGSPCVNTGTNLPVITVDLEGTSRDARCDMGAYERVSMGGPLQVGFSGIPLTGIGSATSVFTAVLEGTNQGIAWWGWDFDNDGTFDQSGGGLETVTNAFDPGRYTVAVRAVNTSGETAGHTNVNYVAVKSAGNDVYVSTNGADTFPFDTWARAATNLNDAVGNAAHGGSTVWVSNGVYGVTAGMALGTNLAVRGMSGPNVTTIYRVSGDFPVFSLSHSNAWVSGFTITNVYYTVGGGGGAVTMSAGTVSNCVMTKSPSYGGNDNGLLRLSGGLVTSCIISNNRPRSWCVTVSGGALEDSVITESTGHNDNSPMVISGGAVRRCRIAGNTPGGTVAGGVNITTASSLLENCLIWGNKATSTNLGAVNLGAGRMVNCTVASNTCSAVPMVSGVYRTGGAMTNCIVYGNLSPGAQYSGAVTSAWYSCAAELVNGEQGNLVANPLFVNLAAGDCHLQKSSPCLNKGYTDAAMLAGVDLDGKPRVKQGVVDMGAYELPPPLGTVMELR